MWRPLFLAIALSVCVLGLECLVIKRATLTIKEPPAAAATAYDYSFLDPSLAAPPPDQGTKRVIEPPEWAPFGLLSAGILLLLYAKSIG